MDILRFAAWWWRQRNTSERFLTCVFVSIAILFVGMYFFGLKALLIFLAGIVVILFIFLLNQLRLAILEQWNKFQAEREREAQRIIQRLGGTVVPDVPKDRMGTILDRIRARRGKPA